MIDSFPLPLLGFAAYSGTGKTTLLCQIIPLLKVKGIRIGVVKHTHHDFDIDEPTKDSYKLRKAGATSTVISSHKRTAIILEHPDNQDDSLEDPLENSLKNIIIDSVDLILVEGFKRSNLPKIELHRKALNKPYLYLDDDNIIAIALDHTLDDPKSPQQLNLNNPQEIADFIEERILKK